MLRSNTLVKVDPDTLPHWHVRNLTAVENVTDEGAPYTWATIIKNKHGRVNLSGVACGRFIAGSNSSRDVERFAKRLSPDTTLRVFIQGSNIIDVSK